MNLTKYYNPLTQYTAFTHGDLFDNVFNYANDSLSSKFYNVEEVDGAYNLELELAGFKKDEVSVEIKDLILTVSAKSKRKQINKSFSLWEDVDSEKIGAVLEDGILKITLNKKEQEQSRKITIK
jgi:HSP20 family protein